MQITLTLTLPILTDEMRKRLANAVSDCVSTIMYDKAKELLRLAYAVDCYYDDTTISDMDRVKEYIKARSAYDILNRYL